MFSIQASLKLGKYDLSKGKKSSIRYRSFDLLSSGKQIKGALIAFFGFYVFGIPSAALLMFYVRIDIFGFWIGIIIAETVTNALLFVLIQRFNWEHHARSALKRVHFNTKQSTIDVATVSVDEEHSPSKLEPNQDSFIKLIRVKIIVLLLFICFLIAGIATSTLIPL